MSSSSNGNSSGYLLWKIYLGLDSFEFPLTNYGDLAFRLYGTVPRHLVNILQTIQLICSVGLIIGMHTSSPIGLLFSRT